MKTIIITLISCLTLFAGCEDNFYDTGIHTGILKCSMWEYMQQDSSNWYLTVRMIKHAECEDIFKGENPDYPEITFFGPKNFSILQYLLKTVDEEDQPLYKTVEDIPAQECREIILSLVIPGRKMMEQFDYEIKGTLTGGTMERTLTDLDLRVYRIKTPYLGVPDIGPESLAIHFKQSDYMANVITSDIQTNNGIVHALSTTVMLFNPTIK